MKNVIDITTGIITLAQLDAGLLAISVTLVALVPTLVEIVRIKSPNFLLGEVARRRMTDGLSNLRQTIWLFGISTFLSVTDFIWGSYVLFMVIIIISLISLVLLIRAGVLIATIARTLI